MEDNLLSPGLIEAGLIPAPVRTVTNLRWDVIAACAGCSGSLGVDPVDQEVMCSLRPAVDCVLPRLLRLAAKNDSIAEKLPTDWVMRHARQTEQDLISESRPTEQGLAA